MIFCVNHVLISSECTDQCVRDTESFEAHRDPLIEPSFESFVWSLSRPDALALMG